MDLELRLEAGDNGEKVRQSGHDGVKIEVHMVRSDVRSKTFGSVSCLFTGILCTHKAGVKDATGTVLEGSSISARRVC